MTSIIDIRDFQCPILVEIPNGRIQQSDGNFLNSIAIYSCDDSYELNNIGNSIRVCTKSSWSGTEPTCQRNGSKNIKSGRNELHKQKPAPNCKSEPSNNSKWINPKLFIHYSALQNRFSIKLNPIIFPIL